MKTVNIRQAKANLSRYIDDKSTFIIMNGSKPAALMVPWAEIEDNEKIEEQFKWAAIESLATKIALERTEKGISEEEILNDFEEFRKNRN